MSIAAYVVAIVLFILAGLGVNLDQLSSLELSFFGLAAFTLGHVLP